MIMLHSLRWKRLLLLGTQRTAMHSSTCGKKEHHTLHEFLYLRNNYKKTQQSCYKITGLHDEWNDEYKLLVNNKYIKGVTPVLMQSTYFSLSP